MEHDEHRGKAEHTKELEIYPGVAIEVAHDIEVGPAQAQKKDNPAKIEASPYLPGQGQVGPQHPLDGSLLAKDMAEQKSHPEKPVNDGRLPLDELLVMQKEGQTAKDDDNRQGGQLHRRNLAGRKPRDGDLHQCGGNDNPGGDIDIEKFVGDEKKIATFCIT